MRQTPLPRCNQALQALPKAVRPALPASAESPQTGLHGTSDRAAYQNVQLWPDIRVRQQDFWQRRHDYKFYRRIFNRKNVNLALLHVCKRVNAEVVEVSHGQNELRFSGTHGFIVAAAFVYTIEVQNTRWLMDLSIAMPPCSEDRSYYANQNNPDPGRLSRDVGEGSWAGLHHMQIVRSGGAMSTR
ncbi:uncharacterized protein M421DRAFT_90995 [Didymella exigua CBS 183.55]|uniref:Uncharacterized protein n=1 Tax=Didymella exigua CBS 183.55 TaxID=1150837 RepID=A0A6A5RQ56_9PLEO|nr:uncharacterized protein M421DRAFT_90995 [Didymella exigua CBS 183.55]KAF1930465.1 hypothetical protein M421DRAFT_90995 [Didymella exigua CBS 183.55]